MASPYHLAIPGRFVIVGKEPDGDSVRFVADRPELYRQLQRAYRIKPSRDGSVQLRLEGIDATELHYGTAAQPLGANSRDRLLALMGFHNIRFGGAQLTLVEAAEPDGVRGTILTKAADANGRPISYVLLAADATGLSAGQWVDVDAGTLDRTLNLRLLREGLVYYTVYTSTPWEHRQRLREIAGAARNAGLGVWGVDSTADFVLENQDSIGPNGQVILPKLFRRCTDYLKDVDRGYDGNLADWIVDHSAGSRSEDDGVVVNDAFELHLSDLIEQRNRHVVFNADLLAITFVEK
jgi:endonuclease YncB( thermonuclease family)